MKTKAGAKIAVSKKWTAATEAVVAKLTGLLCKFLDELGTELSSKFRKDEKENNDPTDNPVSVVGTTEEVYLYKRIYFPDSPDRGDLAIKIFPYHGKIRVDLWIDHDRIIVDQKCEPPCFLNDYEASITVELDPIPEKLPADFTKMVTRGVAEALTAVDRYNSRAGVWGRIRVASARRRR